MALHRLINELPVLQTPPKRISGDSVVDQFYSLVEYEETRNHHESIQTELDISADTSMSTSGVSPIPPIVPGPKEDSGNSSARSSVSDLVLDEDDDIDLSKLTVEERKRLPAAVVLNYMLKHDGITEDGLKLIKNKENLEDAEKLLRLVFRIRKKSKKLTIQESF